MSVVSLFHCFVSGPNEGCGSVLQLFVESEKQGSDQEEGSSLEVTLTHNAAICQVLSDTVKVSVAFSLNVVTFVRTSRHQRYFSFSTKLRASLQTDSAQ